LHREKGLFAAAQAVLAPTNFVGATITVRMKLFAAAVLSSTKKKRNSTIAENPEFTRRKLSGICLGRGKGTRLARGGSVLLSNPLYR